MSDNLDFISLEHPEIGWSMREDAAIALTSTDRLIIWLPDQNLEEMTHE